MRYYILAKIIDVYVLLHCTCTLVSWYCCMAQTKRWSANFLGCCKQCRNNLGRNANTNTRMSPETEVISDVLGKQLSQFRLNVGGRHFHAAGLEQLKPWMYIQVLTHATWSHVCHPTPHAPWHCFCQEAYLNRQFRCPLDLCSLWLFIHC